MTTNSASDTDNLDKLVHIQQQLLNANFNLEDFMNLVVNELLKITPATGAVIELADGDDMVYRAATGSIQNYIGLRLPRKGSMTGLCIEEKEVLISKDTENDKRVNLEACRKVHARSMVVAPLFHNGKPIGVLKIISDQPNGFSDKDVKLLQIMAGFLGSALANQIFAELRNFL